MEVRETYELKSAGENDSFESTSYKLKNKDLPPMSLASRVVYSLFKYKYMITAFIIIVVCLYKLGDFLKVKIEANQELINQAILLLQDSESSMKTRDDTQIKSEDGLLALQRQTLFAVNQGFHAQLSLLESQLAEKYKPEDKVTSDKKPGSQETYRWTFDYYEPSEYENLWMSNIIEWQQGSCERLKEAPHFNNSVEIIRRIKALKAISEDVIWEKVDSFTADQKLEKVDELMSKFHYKRERYNENSQTWERASGRGIQLIEPLWGFLRDPFDYYCRQYGAGLDYPGGFSGDGGQSKEHIMPQGYAPYAYILEGTAIPLDSWRLRGIPPWHSTLNPVVTKDGKLIWEPPKNALLDLGSAYFGNWGGDSSAASGKWFWQTYHKRGQKFNRFVQVEVTPLDPKTAYQQLPHDLVGAYTLINAPLDLNSESSLDVRNLIRQLVKPNDWFVLKVDIDTAPLEDNIVNSILNDDTLANLVDEFMFEHHVNVDVMRAVWDSSANVLDMHDSYNLFQAWRIKGVRAHSWP